MPSGAITRTLHLEPCVQLYAWSNTGRRWTRCLGWWLGLWFSHLSTGFLRQHCGPLIFCLLGISRKARPCSVQHRNWVSGQCSCQFITTGSFLKGQSLFSTTLSLFNAFRSCPKFCPSTEPCNYSTHSVRVHSIHIHLKSTVIISITVICYFLTCSW